MQRTLTAIGALALFSVGAIASPPAHALPLAKAQASPQRGIELIVKKSREDDDSAKSKSRRAGDEKEAKDAKEAKSGALRYGSRMPGTGIPLTPRGAYLYGPTFQGAYMPPGGYSAGGYPIRYADEVTADQAECSALRRQALSSGKRASWDRYYACVED